MRMYVRMARATRRASILYPGAVTRTRPGSHGSRVAGRRFWPGSRVAGRRSATPCDPANPALWVLPIPWRTPLRGHSAPVPVRSCRGGRSMRRPVRARVSLFPSHSHSLSLTHSLSLSLSLPFSISSLILFFSSLTLFLDLDSFSVSPFLYACVSCSSSLSCAHAPPPPPPSSFLSATVCCLQVSLEVGSAGLPGPQATERPADPRRAWPYFRVKSQ